MKIHKVKIAELNPAEYNPRRMTNKQYEDLKNSLEKFGCVDPINNKRRQYYSRWSSKGKNNERARSRVCTCC